jgi:F-type H+-transporting ATPase subunit epsilon
MEKTLNLEIITPYRTLYSGQANMVIFLSEDGEMGILPDHEPIVTTVGIGAMRIKTGDDWRVAAVADGILETKDNKATFLVSAAEWPEDIDVERAERSLKRAQDRLAEQVMRWETTRCVLALERAKTRLKVAALAEPKAEAGSGQTGASAGV